VGIFDRHLSDAAAPSTAGAKPTVVVVHGAFADATAFGEVAAHLIDEGFPVMAVANPLRDLHTDAAYVRSVLDAVAGPVVLVGHSYAGSVITQAAAGAGNVRALVYVAAFIPRVGESSAELNGMFAGSLLTPDNLVALPTPDGHTDLYIRPERYEEVYAGA
jgi:pimeloyl-ACP methyl ester carboxylesterase